jgi:hypothetical protein
MQLTIISRRRRRRRRRAEEGAELFPVLKSVRDVP